MLEETIGFLTIRHGLYSSFREYFCKGRDASLFVDFNFCIRIQEGMVRGGKRDGKGGGEGGRSLTTVVGAGLLTAAGSLGRCCDFGPSMWVAKRI